MRNWYRDHGGEDGMDAASNMFWLCRKLGLGT